MDFVIAVLADALAPNSARPSADTMLTDKTDMFSSMFLCHWTFPHCRCGPDDVNQYVRWDQWNLLAFQVLTFLRQSTTLFGPSLLYFQWDPDMTYCWASTIISIFCWLPGDSRNHHATSVHVLGIDHLRWAPFRDHSRYGLSQWEEVLHSNAFSHWLSPNLEWSMSFLSGCHWRSVENVCRTKDTAAVYIAVFYFHLRAWFF